MPTLRIPPDLDLHYLVDDFTDPWRKPETILMLHGNAESSRSWYAWVPVLARHYRVVRPDMRGFGESTPMPAGFAWTLDVIIDDYCRLMDELGIERFHLVAAKIGGTIADMLRQTVDYSVTVADRSAAALDALARTGIATLELDIADAVALRAAMKGRYAVLSAAPYHLTGHVAQAAELLLQSQRAHGMASQQPGGRQHPRPPGQLPRSRGQQLQVGMA